MDLTELPGRPCPVAGALELVGDRWSLLVVREIDLGVHRFTEIQKGTGAPRDRLAARLKALVDAGILRRERYCDAPERFDYHLTDAGRELVPVLRALFVWGDRWASTPGPGVPATPRPATDRGVSRYAVPGR
jgi:DNA-binding HxlR family transcriptional regulator